MKNSVKKLSEIISHSERIVVFTGAGISTQSGIPDFRGTNGLWLKYKPISFDEFILAFFLSSSDQTLPIYMWSQLRFPKKFPHILALGAIIIIVTSLIVMTAYWLRNLGQGKKKDFSIGI